MLTSAFRCTHRGVKSALGDLSSQELANAGWTFDTTSHASQALFDAVADITRPLEEVKFSSHGE
eukprot:3486160-Karenia_brevis.AAC.1